MVTHKRKIYFAIIIIMFIARIVMSLNVFTINIVSVWGPVLGSDDLEKRNFAR